TGCITPPSIVGGRMGESIRLARRRIMSEIRQYIAVALRMRAGHTVRFEQHGEHGYTGAHRPAIVSRGVVIFSLVLSGAIKPIVAETFPLAEGADALRLPG